eukprot:356395-Chlamydomonas_euryale.AAC.4
MSTLLASRLRHSQARCAAAAVTGCSSSGRGSSSSSSSSGRGGSSSRTVPTCRRPAVPCRHVAAPLCAIRRAGPPRLAVSAVSASSPAAAGNSQRHGGRGSSDGRRGCVRASVVAGSLADVFIGVLHGGTQATTAVAAPAATALAADAVAATATGGSGGLVGLLQGLVSVGSAAVSSLSAASQPEIVELQKDVTEGITAVEASATALPGPLSGWVQVLGDDFIGVVLLHPTTQTVLRLTVRRRGRFGRDASVPVPAHRSFMHA